MECLAWDVIMNTVISAWDCKEVPMCGAEGRELQSVMKTDGFDHRVGHFRPPGIVDVIPKPPVLQGLRCFY